MRVRMCGACAMSVREDCAGECIEADEDKRTLLSVPEDGRPKGTDLR